MAKPSLRATAAATTSLLRLGQWDRVLDVAASAPWKQPNGFAQGVASDAILAAVALQQPDTALRIAKEAQEAGVWLGSYAAARLAGQLVAHGRVPSAFDVLDHMRANRKEKESFPVQFVLKECRHAGLDALARMVAHDALLHRVYLPPAYARTTIDAVLRQQSPDQTAMLFRRLSPGLLDLLPIASIRTAIAQIGHSENAEQGCTSLVDAMAGEGKRIDRATVDCFLIALKQDSIAAERLLQRMLDHGAHPDATSYRILARFCARQGRRDTAAHYRRIAAAIDPFVL